MPTINKKSDFFDSEEGIKIKEALRLMAANDEYHTESSYSADIVNNPDNLISFVDKHLKYLRSHPTTNPWHYVSNLRLMTRKRTAAGKQHF